MNKQNNYPALSVASAVNKISKMLCAFVQHNKIEQAPSVMLWGAPGVGKSQGVRQMANRVQQETGKNVVVTDVRLLLFNPVDLRGIPTTNADKSLAVWLKPQIFQMDASQDIVNILFLDEISAAPASVQAAAYQITLDHKVGEHKLPQNCFVIAAGNRTTDNSVAYNMPKALANRLLHIEIEGNFSSWQEWAINSGLNPKVLGFLSYKQDRLFGFDPSKDELAFATPRSWEAVSNLMNTVDDNIEEMFDLVAGLVGIGSAIEFSSWAKVYSTLPDIEKIFDGREYSVPTSLDALYALVMSMGIYAREHKNELDRIGHSIAYCAKFPSDFRMLLLTLYTKIGKDFSERLKTLPEYADVFSRDWVKKNGSVH